MNQVRVSLNINALHQTLLNQWELKQQSTSHDAQSSSSSSAAGSSEVQSKANKKRVHKSRLTYKRNWEEKYTRVTVTIQRRVCSAKFVKSGGVLHQMHVMDGRPEESLT